MPTSKAYGKALVKGLTHVTLTNVLIERLILQVLSTGAADRSRTVTGRVLYGPGRSFTVPFQFAVINDVERKG